MIHRHCMLSQSPGIAVTISAIACFNRLKGYYI
jgi:hypothetical protein